MTLQIPTKTRAREREIAKEREREEKDAGKKTGKNETGERTDTNRSIASRLLQVVRTQPESQRDIQREREKRTDANGSIASRLL